MRRKRTLLRRDTREGICKGELKIERKRWASSSGSPKNDQLRGKIQTLEGTSVKSIWKRSNGKIHVDWKSEGRGKIGRTSVGGAGGTLIEER